MYLLTREKSITRIHQILMKLVTPRGGRNGMERMEGWEIESKRWGILEEKKINKVKGENAKWNTNRHQ